MSSAIKHDKGKAPLSLIPFEALEAEALVMRFGAEKYGRDNWRGGMEWTRCIDAALRHIHAFANGEDSDPETGYSHLAHARCCLAFLLAYQVKELGTDDRVGKQPPSIGTDKQPQSIGTDKQPPSIGTDKQPQGTKTNGHFHWRSLDSLD